MFGWKNFLSMVIGQPPKAICDKTITREEKIIHLMCISVIGKGKR